MRIAKAGVLKDDELALFRQIKAERQIARLNGDDKELKRLCDEFHRIRYERGIKRFELGRTYFRMDGRSVIIVACKDTNRGYECVVASDGTKKSPEIHRYNRSTRGLDNGRVTGSDHCFTDPRNLIAERPSEMKFILLIVYLMGSGSGEAEKLGPFDTLEACQATKRELFRVYPERSHIRFNAECIKVPAGVQ